MYIQNKTSVSRREQKNFLARVDKSWNHVYNPCIYHVKNPSNVWMIIMKFDGGVSIWWLNQPIWKNMSEIKITSQGKSEHNT